MRLVVLAALTLPTLWAQPFPDGTTLLKNSESALRKLGNYVFDDQTTTGTLLAGHTLTDQSEIHLAKMGPGKARMELRDEDEDLIAVSDGRSTWIHSAGWHQYVKRSSISSPEDMLTELGVDDMMPHFGDAHVDSKTIAEEPITIQGRKYACWVVEMHVESMDLSGPGHGKVTGATITGWFDKKLGIQLQSTLYVKVLTAEGGPEFEMRQKTVRTRMQIGGTVPAAEFEFSPPPESKQVPKLSMFGGKANSLQGVVGQAAAPFHELAGAAGKEALLEFWTDRCAPCEGSLPVLKKLSSELNLSAVPVHVGAEFDPDVLQKYQVVAYPTFVLVDSEGKIAAYRIGFDGEESLREVLARSQR